MLGAHIDRARQIAMIILKWLTLACSMALAGCCASGTGCYAPVPGTPIAWDGLGSAPTENGSDENKPRRKSRRNHEIIVGPLNEAAAQSDPQSQFKDRWIQEQDAERDADVKLNKQLRICTNC
jgi:hypothetical protein